MSMTDLENRILDKLVELDRKIDNLCNWKTQMETEWKIHIESLKTENETKNKRVYIVLAVMAGVVGVVEMLRSFY